MPTFYFMSQFYLEGCFLNLSPCGTAYFLNFFILFFVFVIHESEPPVKILQLPELSWNFFRVSSSLIKYAFYSLNCLSEFSCISLRLFMRPILNPLFVRSQNSMNLNLLPGLSFYSCGIVQLWFFTTLYQLFLCWNI